MAVVITLTMAIFNKSLKQPTLSLVCLYLSVMKYKIYLVAILSIALSCSCTLLNSQVINEVYTGGGNTSPTATYSNDAVILKGTPGASLSGWSIQYTGASGTTWSSTKLDFAASAVFNASGFFYIQYGGAFAGPSNLPNPPFTPGSNSFASVTNNMSATGGKIALVSNTTGLSAVACPTPSGGGTILDFIGYGTANCSEGNNNNTTAASLGGNSANTYSYKRTNFVDTNNNLNDFSANAAPLPIELVDFQVYQKETNVVLTWITAREQDNHRFVVERSTDGKQYESIGEVAGQGTSSVIQNYEFTDTKPLNGTNYYRLRQVDFDGMEDISPVRSVKISLSGHLSIAPNPAGDSREVVLYYESVRENDVRISVINMLGTLVLEQQANFVKGDNYIAIDLSNLVTGSYFVRLDEGSQAPLIQQIVVK
jgi:Secretion system C-terminal sorting domain